MVKHRTDEGSNVFPQRDLPGRSEEWGRTVEKRIENVEENVKRSDQRLNNDLRALVSGGEVSLNAVNGKRIYGADIIGGRIVQEGGTPIIHDYVVPITPSDPGGWYSGYGTGKVTLVSSTGLPAGIESTARLTSNENPVSPPGSTEIVFHAPEMFFGAPIVVSFLAWSSTNATVESQGGFSQSIPGNTWTRVYLPSFTPTDNLQVSIGFTSLQEVWVTETWVTPIGRSMSSAIMETRRGVPGVWFERDGADLGSVTPNSLKVRHEWPPELDMGTYSQTEVYPGAVVFSFYDKEQDPHHVRQAVVSHSDGHLNVWGPSGFSVSTPATFHQDVNINAPINSYPTKTALDAWSAPNGTMAWVEADNRHYVRVVGAWLGLTADLHYSTTVQDTGRKWVNGKPVFQQTFTGSITQGANTRAFTSLRSGVDDVISLNGYFQVGDGTKFGVPAIQGNNGMTNWFHMANHYVHTNGTLTMTTQDTASRTNREYAVTALFTLRD